MLQIRKNVLIPKKYLVRSYLEKNNVTDQDIHTSKGCVGFDSIQLPPIKCKGRHLLETYE
jgi:hypothetical protein